MNERKRQSINALAGDVYKRQAYERGYRKGYGEGLEDGTVEIHSHIDVYHFPEKFQIK